jgi:peptide methionine sulfoxide reductase MsrA
VVYDLRQLSTQQLLIEFFTLHNFSADRSKAGGQYRSAIFFLAGKDQPDVQWTTAEKMLELLKRKGYSPSTQIEAISAFYPAAARHQQYCSARGIIPKRAIKEEILKILTF